MHVTALTYSSKWNFIFRTLCPKYTMHINIQHPSNQDYRSCTMLSPLCVYVVLFGAQASEVWTWCLWRLLASSRSRCFQWLLYQHCQCDVCDWGFGRDEAKGVWAAQWDSSACGHFQPSMYSVFLCTVFSDCDVYTLINCWAGRRQIIAPQVISVCYVPCLNKVAIPVRPSPTVSSVLFFQSMKCPTPYWALLGVYGDQGPTTRPL